LENVMEFIVGQGWLTFMLCVVLFVLVCISLMQRQTHRATAIWDRMASFYTMRVQLRSSFGRPAQFVPG